MGQVDLSAGEKGFENRSGTPDAVEHVRVTGETESDAAAGECDDDI